MSSPRSVDGRTENHAAPRCQSAPMCGPNRRLCARELTTVLSSMYTVCYEGVRAPRAAPPGARLCGRGTPVCTACTPSIITLQRMHRNIAEQLASRTGLPNNRRSLLYARICGGRFSSAKRRAAGNCVRASRGGGACGATRASVNCTRSSLFSSSSALIVRRCSSAVLPALKWDTKHGWLRPTLPVVDVGPFGQLSLAACQPRACLLQLGPCCLELRAQIAGIVALRATLRRIGNGRARASATGDALAEPVAVAALTAAAE
jgi:hypothetical protein